MTVKYISIINYFDLITDNIFIGVAPLPKILNNKFKCVSDNETILHRIVNNKSIN